MARIMFLSANPTDTQRLRLDEENRAIRQALQQADFGKQFQFEQHWAVRVNDLQRLLLSYEPNIVHFCGHGTSKSGIILQNDNGQSQLVPENALGQLFSLFKKQLRCVLLNSCYSEFQAEAIAKHIDCVIGMSGILDDKSATNFASAFYQGLGYGKDVQMAYDLGCSQIDLASLQGQAIPRLLAHRVDASKIVLTRTSDSLPHEAGSISIIEQLRQVRRNSIEKQLMALLADYDAVNNQIIETLDEAGRLRLQRQLQTLDRQIADAQQKLGELF